MRRYQMIRNMYQPKTSRDLLLDLGVGQYNATMLVETLMMAPATTEAAAAPTMLLVGHIQENLNEMGANLICNGYIDKPTDDALRCISPRYLERSWFDVVRDVVAAHKAGVKLRSVGPYIDGPTGTGDAFSSSIGSTVAVGTLAAYAAGGLLLWHVLSKSKKKSKRI